MLFLAAFTLNDDKTLTSDNVLYWKDTKEATVTAWYPVYEGESGTVSLADQSQGLVYVLKGSGTGTYQNAVSLSFSHALAKVRVTLDGDQAKDVKEVKIKSYTSCTHAKGENIQGSGTKDWITMNKPSGANYWEANVVPNVAITEFQVNGQSGTLKGDGITPLGEAVSKYFEMAFFVFSKK